MRMNLDKRAAWRSLVSASALALATHAGSALAQPASSVMSPGSAATPAVDASETGLQDIIVTARRKSESLLNVPVAVSAVSAATLQRANVVNLQKLSDIVPQVTLTKTPAGGGAVFAIRGIGTPSGDPAAEQTVSIVLDGMPVGRGRVALQSLFDVKQVEVLKGPQALFFGKNSTGGVVSISSNEPTSEFGGYIRAGYEFVANERFVEGVLSGPLTSTLSARVAIRASGMDGWLKNDPVPRENPFDPSQPFTTSIGSSFPRSDELGVRGSLKWTPTEALIVKASYTRTRVRDSGDGGSYENFCNNGDVHVTTLGVPDVQSDCKLDRHIAVNQVPEKFLAGIDLLDGGKAKGKFDSNLGILNVTYGTGPVSVTSTTGYYSFKSQAVLYFDVTSFAPGVGDPREDTHSFTQEVRFISDFEGSLNFSAGAFYENYNSKNFSTSLFGPAFGGLPDSRTGFYKAEDVDSELKSTSLSAFAQLRWKIVPEVEIAVGARFSHDKKSRVAVNSFVNDSIPGFFYPENVPLIDRYKKDNLSPEATISWKPTPNQTIYAAVKMAYKAGGPSIPQVLVAKFLNPTTATSYKPEKAKGGEIGYKASLFDRRLRLDTVAYWYQFDDLQRTYYDAANVAYIPTNAASARSRGVEITADFQATPDFVLNANVGYNRAQFISFKEAGCNGRQLAGLLPGCAVSPVTGNAVQDLSGRTLPMAPKLTLRLGGDYDMEVGPDLGLSFSGSANYVSSYNVHDGFDVTTQVKRVVKFDASIRLHDLGDKWEFALVGRNLSNRYLPLYIQDKTFGTAGQYVASTGRPRELGLQARYNF